MTDKKEDVAFLADNFDLPARRAAALVADTAQEAAALTAAQLQEERARNPYGDAPVPTSPEDGEVDDNGGLQKTVLRRRNDASRTGP